MKKILVIEDEKPLVTAITKKLEIKNYQVMPVRTAEEGLRKLKENPDLIWLDLLLPKMQGLEFLNKIKDMPKYNKIPIIVVSNSSSQDKIDNAFELNVVKYFVKAEYGLEEIIRKMEKII